MALLNIEKAIHKDCFFCIILRLMLQTSLSWLGYFVSVKYRTSKKDLIAQIVVVTQTR